MTEPFENRLRSLAQGFPYPPTPNVARKVMAKLNTPAPRPILRRRWVQALLAIVILFASLMAVPPVRAAVLDFIQIGIVRIFPSQPTVAPSLEAPVTSTPQAAVPATATSAPSEPPLISFLEQLAGETTLDDARQQVEFPIPLPTHPADLGQPDRIFVQNANGWMIVLVWLDPADPSLVRMSLHLIQDSSWAINKMGPTVIQETTMNGRRAVWAEGDYPLLLRNGDIEFTRLIQGHVLIWEGDGVTYRLETALSLEETIRIAESLQAP